MHKDVYRCDRCGAESDQYDFLHTIAVCEKARFRQHYQDKWTDIESLDLCHKCQHSLRLRVIEIHEARIDQEKRAKEESAASAVDPSLADKFVDIVRELCAEAFEELQQ